LAEWLVEEGIGETRAVLVQADEVRAAKLIWPGELAAGQIVSVKLSSTGKMAGRGVGTMENGAEILLDRLPPSASEGASYTARITRAAITERGRYKRAQARLLADGEDASTSAPPTPLNLPDARIVRRFPAGLWEDVWSTASQGEVDFAGGSLVFSTNPGMNVVDVDGDLPPLALSLAAVPALARALQLFDLGGSIAVDFPTIASKAERKQVDAALEKALAGWPHERTAMNGFGLVQIVTRLQGPSLLHRFASSRVGACARAVLRRAQGVAEPGALLLCVHPALKAKLKPEWLAQLARETGREVRIETDPGLALEAGFAQAVPL